MKTVESTFKKALSDMTKEIHTVQSCLSVMKLTTKNEDYSIKARMKTIADMIEKAEEAANKISFF